jgi:predicted PurR-regulated permease PerM
MNSSAQASRNFYVLLTVVVVVAALRLAQEVFVPLALAMLLTFLLAPAVNWLQRVGINRTVAVLFTVAVAAALLAGVMYVVFDQLKDVARELPLYRRQLIHNLQHLTSTFHGSLGRTFNVLQELSNDLRKVAPVPTATTPVPKVQVVPPPITGFEAVREVFAPLIAPVAMAAVVLVFVVFMLLRFPDLRDRIIRLLGARNLRLATEAIEDAARRVSRYLLMQTLINGWEGLCVAVGLTLIGVPNAILWGALTTVLRFIPYVGIWVALAMPLALSFAVFDRWAPPLLVVVLFGAVETLSYVVLEPWLYSRRTGVSPVALLASAVFWAWLWGAAGLFLAIPLTVCLVVMGKYIPALKFLDVLLSDQPVLAPHERLYQRLLANNPEDADELLESELDQHALAEVCDRVVLPALQLLERDHEQGQLRESKRKSVLDHIERWTEELADTAATRSVGFASALAAAAHESAPGAEVICLGAVDRADEITARLFALVVGEIPLVARAVPRGGLRELEGSVPGIIVISALPRDGVTQARTVCRQARRLFPHTPVLVGLWHSAADPERCWSRLAGAGATRLASTFEAGALDVQALAAARAETLRAAPARPPPAVGVAPVRA